MVLVGYWPLNESSGNTAYDHSGNENHGTIYDDGDSTVPGAQGILGQNSFSFDGSNDYVELSMTSGLSREGSDKLSVCTWINIQNPSHGIINGRPFLILHWDSDSLPSALKFYVGAGGSWSSVTPEKSISEGWHHWTGIYDGRELKIYLDGDLVGQKSVSGNIASTGDGDSQWITFGKDYHPSYTTGRYNQGRISEVRIYNHALTPSEVQYLYSVSRRGRAAQGRKRS